MIFRMYFSKVLSINIEITQNFQEPNDLVLARYTDGLMYRARVETIEQHIMTASI